MRSGRFLIVTAAVFALTAGNALLAEPQAPRGAPAARQAEWPTWRGPNRDGHSPDRGLMRAWPQGGPRLMMTVKNLGAGFSSVAVSGGRIYTMGDRGGAQHLIALSDSDGREVWSIRVGATHDDEYGGPRGTPAVSDGAVYALGTEGDLVAVDAASGKELWRRNLERDFGGDMMSGWKYAES